MSVKSQDLDSLKNRLKSLVSNRLTDLIVSQEVPYTTIKEVAVDLIEVLGLITTKEQLSAFVKEMADPYPFLKEQSKIMMAEMNEVKEAQVINKLESYFKNVSH